MSRSWRTAALVTTVVVGCGLAGWLGLHAVDLRIRVDEFELLPRSSNVLKADREIRETFGSDERFVIGVTSTRRDVTDPIFLGDLDFLVRQLHTSRNFGTLLHDRLGRARYRSEPVDGAPWLLHPPDSAWVERALDVSPLMHDLAVGRSRRTAFLETPSLSGQGVTSLQERLAEAVALLEQRRPGEYVVRVVGRDVVLNGLGVVIYDDLVRLLPWTFAVVFVLLWVAFRSVPLAMIALAEVGLAVLSTLGVLALLGLDLSIMTALVPVLVTVLGIADEIHLFGELARWSRTAPDASRFEQVRRALAQVVFPITATTLTTAIGFASFLFTDVPALHAFGLLASLGVCFSWLYTVTVVPALLALVPLALEANWAEPAPTTRRHWWLGRSVAVAVTVLALPGWFGLRVDDGWTRNFDQDHPIVQDVEWFQGESVGLYAFDVVLRRLDGEPWTEPSSLRRLDGWVAEVKASPRVTAAFSIADLVRDRSWELGDLAAERPPIPSTRHHVERLLATFLDFNEQIVVDTFLDPEHRLARVRVFTTGDDYDTSSSVRALLDRSVDATWGESVQVEIGGSAERGRVLIETIVVSQGRSVLALLVMAWVTLGLASGHWRLAARCVVVIAWALAVVLGVAGWLGLDLGVASSCCLALGLGVGLDYAIHLAFGDGGTATDRLARARIRRRVIANVVVVGAGLSVLCLSTNPTLVELGLLVVASMVACGWAVLVAFGDPLIPEKDRERPGVPTERNTGP